MNWFKNLNAMPKLMLSFGLILAFTAGIGLTGVFDLASQSEQSDLWYKRDVIGIVTIKDFEVTKAKIATTSRNAIIASSKNNARQEVDKQEKQFNDLFGQLQDQAKKISTLVFRPDMKEIVDQISALLPDYEQRSRLIFQYARNGDTAQASAALASNADLIAKLNSLTADAGRLKLHYLETSRSDQAENARTTRGTMLSLMGLTLLIGFGLSFVISRSFSRPLVAAVQLLEGLGKGDLTHRLTVATKDEIGKLGSSLNRAMDSMDRALSEVGSSAKNLSTSSQQLARAAEALATGAQEQAASLQETSASLEEITATVRQNSDNAKHASQLAVSSRDSAEKGGAAAVETVAAMGEIKSSSSKIAEIITTIDEIAFQTNLLSVNASVEAARAGVHGNGFKVVATEVRNLAQRSAAAAKEIKTLINGSVRKVENGSTLVTNSGATLKEIVASVNRVSDIVGEIAAASQEQATGIEQVGKAMIQMDRVTQSNSSQTEELSATASSLASQSTHLESLVSRFVLTSTESKQPAAFAAPVAALTVADLARDDAAHNLENMAKNVGQSVLGSARDREFEEF